MIEKGIQGGISMILNRFPQGNNEYLGEAYNETKPTRPTTYLDANNLYGWAICEPLLLEVSGKWQILALETGENSLYSWVSKRAS